MLHLINVDAWSEESNEQNKGYSFPFIALSVELG